MNKAFVLLLPTVIMSACSVNDEKNTPLSQFSANEVTLRNSEFAERQQWDKNFMMSLDVDRLLYFFLDESNREGLESYGSWENADLKGHTLGHYLTAMSMLYAQDKDPEVQRRIDRAIDGMEECQKRLGTGLITAFRLDLLDECETQGTGWAPYYTLHKLLQGLLDAYTFGQNEKALRLASAMGDHFAERKKSIEERGIDWAHNLDIMEVGGFGESMLNLYALTLNPAHLDVARFFHQMSKLAPVAEGRDELEDPAHLAQHRNRRSPNDDELHNMHHSNATIPQFMAAARDFELTGDSLYWRAADNFWHFVTQHRTYCNGTTGNFEHWNYGPDSLSMELDYRAGETCCTYNMIKLSNELFRLHPDEKYASYVEKALVNDIMGAIYPETADFMYFHTQKPGSHKTFGKNDEVFWCCTGSGMENPQRYVESIYFTDNENLYVNLPIASNLNWQSRAVKLSLESAFPTDGKSEIKIEEGSADFAICMRIPAWCKEYEISLNGKPIELPNINGYARCKREWKPGDVISLYCKMELRAEPLADDHTMVALFYGPLVLAADLGGVDSSLIHVTDNFYGGVPDEWQAIDDIPTLVGDITSLSQWILPAGKPCTFKTTATSDGRELVFRPLYQITDNRFADYLKIN